MTRNKLSRMTPSCKHQFTSLEAKLAAVEDPGQLPVDTTTSASVKHNPAAIETYTELGKADASHPGADEHTGPGRPTQPSTSTVRTWSRAPLEALGEQFFQVKTAYASGTYGMVKAQNVTNIKVLRTLWPHLVVLLVLVAAAIITEVVYGQHAAALLTGSRPQQALAAAIAFTIVLNGAAFFAAHWAYDAYPTMVRRHGVKVLGGVLFLIAVVALGLGLVVGGYDPIQISGVSGGGEAAVSVPRPDTRPLLTMTYTGIIVLITVAIAAGHLLFLHLFDSRMVTEVKRAEAHARNSSLDREQRRRVVTAVGDSYLAAIPTAHQEGQRRVSAFNAAFRRHCAPDIGEIFLDVTYDSTNPTWADDAREFIETVKNAEQPSPPLSLIA